MTNVHIPERLPNESQADYRARQRASRIAVERMTLAGIGNQHTAPGSREQLRRATRERLHANGKKRAAAHRAIQRAKVSA